MSAAISTQFGASYAPTTPPLRTGAAGTMPDLKTKTPLFAGISFGSRRPDSNRGPLHYEFGGPSLPGSDRDLERPEKWAVSERAPSHDALGETGADNCSAPTTPPLRAVAS